MEKIEKEEIYESIELNKGNERIVFDHSKLKGLEVDLWHCDIEQPKETTKKIIEIIEAFGQELKKSNNKEVNSEFIDWAGELEQRVEKNAPEDLGLKTKTEVKLIAKLLRNYYRREKI